MSASEEVIETGNDHRGHELSMSAYIDKWNDKCVVYVNVQQFLPMSLLGYEVHYVTNKNNGKHPGHIIGRISIWTCFIFHSQAQNNKTVLV